MEYLLLQNEVVLEIEDGVVDIKAPKLVPYGLYLEEGTDIETRLNNLSNLNNWCAKRVLTLDRKHAKDILNTLGLKQAVTDKDRAEIARTYNCLSLQDSYWLSQELSSRWEDINFFKNHLSNSLVPVSLKGMSATLRNTKLITPDTSTQGIAAKAWVTCDKELWLYKYSEMDKVLNEVTASIIARSISKNVVEYSVREYLDCTVSASKCFTTEEYGFVPAAELDVWCVNNDTTAWEFCRKHFPKEFYELCLITYLVGDKDKHMYNWGVSINSKNQIIGLAPTFDFDHSFSDKEDLMSLIVPGKLQIELAQEACKYLGISEIKNPLTRGWRRDYVDKKIESLF